MNNKITTFIKETLEWKNLLIFTSIIIVCGCGINQFEPYPLFIILFPILLIMLLSTVCILRKILIELEEFKIKYNDLSCINKNFEVLLSNNKQWFSKLVLIVFFFFYFICLCQMKFLTFNLMGCFIFLLGGATFAVALWSYEIYVRFVIALNNVAKKSDYSQIECNKKNPVYTDWLIHIYKLSILLRNSSLIIGALFVFENSMIYIANFKDNFLLNKTSNISLLQKIKYFPLEFWLIWVFVFISIGLAFPLIALLQTYSLKCIIRHLKTQFGMQLLAYHEDVTLYKQPSDFYMVLKIIKSVENSLQETFLPQKTDKAVELITSILTCMIHIASIYSLLF